MKTLIKINVLVFLMVAVALNASAHEGHHHAKKDTVHKTATVADTSKASVTIEQYHKENGFPTLHPLVVHFPIVLLIIAAILQVIGIFYRKDNWDYITLFLLAGGVLSAYLAGSFFHPHTEELPTDAAAILERHELYATFTLYSSLIALIFKITGMFLLKSKKRILEILTAIVLLFSAVSVSVAGHWGSYLTHIEGIGPQGKNLESHE